MNCHWGFIETPTTIVEDLRPFSYSHIKKINYYYYLYIGLGGWAACCNMANIANIIANDLFIIKHR